jgi:hypothetical protein
LVLDVAGADQLVGTVEVAGVADFLEKLTDDGLVLFGDGSLLCLPAGRVFVRVYATAEARLQPPSSPKCSVDEFSEVCIQHLE